jgi:mono/diheme cytochrome c family protein
MNRARLDRRRGAAIVALVALASLGFSLHTHADGTSSSSTIEAATDPAATLHGPGHCVACHAHGRAGLPAWARASLAGAPPAPSLLSACTSDPAIRSAATRAPTPPRGPPLATS